MRASARTILAVICATGVVTAAATSGGSALAAGQASTTAIHTTAATRPWLPPTPTYWPQMVGEQSTRSQTITSGVQYNTDTYQTVGGAQKAQVLNIDLTNPNIKFGGPAPSPA